MKRKFFFLIFFALLFGGFSGLLVSLWTRKSLQSYESFLFSQGPVRLDEIRPQAVKKSEQEALEDLQISMEQSRVWIFEQADFDGIYEKEEAISRGAVVTSDGWIVTISSEPERLQQARIVHDHSVYSVETLVKDPGTSAVFLKISANNLPVLPFFQSTHLSSSDRLVLVPEQNEFFLANVSGMVYEPGASFSPEVPRKRFAFMQDVSFLPAGTLVLNLNGELVGFLEEKNRQRMLPLDILFPALNDLLKYGIIDRPRLGMICTDFSDVVEGSDQQESRFFSGVRIDEVTIGMPAANAGLKKGDVVLFFNGLPLEDEARLDDYLLSSRAGDKIVLMIDRQGKQQEKEVILD